MPQEERRKEERGEEERGEEIGPPGDLDGTQILGQKRGDALGFDARLGQRQLRALVLAHGQPAYALRR